MSMYECILITKSRRLNHFLTLWLMERTPPHVDVAVNGRSDAEGFLVLSRGCDGKFSMRQEY